MDPSLLGLRRPVPPRSRPAVRPRERICSRSSPESAQSSRPAANPDARIRTRPTPDGTKPTSAPTTRRPPQPRSLPGTDWCPHTPPTPTGRVAPRPHADCKTQPRARRQNPARGQSGAGSASGLVSVGVANAEAHYDDEWTSAPVNHRPPRRTRCLREPQVRSLREAVPQRDWTQTHQAARFPRGGRGSQALGGLGTPPRLGSLPRWTRLGLGPSSSGLGSHPRLVRSIAGGGRRRLRRLSRPTSS